MVMRRTDRAAGAAEGPGAPSRVEPPRPQPAMRTAPIRSVPVHRGLSTLGSHTRNRRTPNPDDDFGHSEFVPERIECLTLEQRALSDSRPGIPGTTLVGPRSSVIIPAHRRPLSMKDVVTAQDVQAVPAGGEVSSGAGAIVTPWAREMAATRGVRIVHGAAPRRRAVVVAVGADHGGFRPEGGGQGAPHPPRLPLPRPRHLLHRAGGLSRHRAGRGARRQGRRRAARDPGGRRRHRVGHGRQQGARGPRRGLRRRGGRPQRPRAQRRQRPDPGREVRGRRRARDRGDLPHRRLHRGAPRAAAWRRSRPSRSPTCK